MRQGARGLSLALLLAWWVPQAAWAETGTDVAPGLERQIREKCRSEAVRNGHLGHESFPDESYFKPGYRISARGDVRFVSVQRNRYHALQMVLDGEVVRTSQRVQVLLECRAFGIGEPNPHYVMARLRTDVMAGPGSDKVLKPLEQMSAAERSALKPSEIAARKTLISGPIDMSNPRNREIAARMDRMEERYLDSVKNLCKARAEKDYGAQYAWRVVRMLGRKDWNHSHNFTVVVKAVDAAGNHAYVCEVWARMPADQQHWVEGEFVVGRFYKNNEVVIVEGMK